MKKYFRLLIVMPVSLIALTIFISALPVNSANNQSYTPTSNTSLINTSLQIRDGQIVIAEHSTSEDSNESSDLDITKQGPDRAQVNDVVTYTLSLSNVGLLAAETTIITDRLPSNTVYIHQESPFSATVTNQMVIWDAGTVSPSLHYTWTLSVLITETSDQQMTNRITCTTSSTETNYLNNIAQHMTQVGEPEILISAVLFDGYQLYDNDEAIEITNPTSENVDINGWKICKPTASNLYCTILPDAVIGPGQSLWLAKDTGAFQISFGHPPDVELPTWVSLANDGAILYLLDEDSNHIDTLVYGDITEQTVGWSGHSVNSYYNHLRGTTGQILKRIPDEVTGLPIPDTNTQLDWMQNTEDPLHGRRVWYPGWVKDPFFWTLTAQEQATIVVGIAPDNAFEVISEAILKAQQSISIEVYTFNNPHLLPVLIQKANEGVIIKVLLEGNPVGLAELSTEWQTQLYICSEIEQVGGECWFMIHDTDQRIYNRYEFIHSKIILIDDTWVVVGSQNFTNNSLPADDKSNGTFGTRGCLIATTAPSVIARVQDIFTHDIDFARFNDLIRWNTGPDSRYIGYQPDLVDLSTTDHVSYTTYFSKPLILNEEFHIETFSSPESALRESDTLLGLVGRAGEGDIVLTQQMYEYASWGTNPEEGPNVRLQAYIAAARRGALVRIFLNGQGYAANGNSIAEENLETVAYVNAIGLTEQLNLRAALGNPTGGGVHNKMVLVDLNHQGQYSHIGSINGSEGSSKVNREIAVQVKSESLYKYLKQLFELDWWLSNRIYLPLIVKNLTPPPPPINHLVISEVFYSTDPALEWIEIYNPTDEQIQLDGWKIGDAELPTNYEGMLYFPVSSTIHAHSTIVVAVNAIEVYEADFEFYESDPSVRNMVPDPNWGSTEFPLSFRDAGDQVLILDSAYAVVDSVVWGDATLSGIVPHPGKTNVSASLERYPPYYDSDNCLLDFRERNPPTPGEIPLN